VLPGDVQLGPSSMIYEFRPPASIRENTVDIVMKKLQQLKTDKSPGLDGIHPLLLRVRECATVLTKPLLLIFQQSYNTGILPDEWTTAHIVPIFKKGIRTDPANYHSLPLMHASDPGSIPTSSAVFLVSIFIYYK